MKRNDGHQAQTCDCGECGADEILRCADCGEWFCEPLLTVREGERRCESCDATWRRWDALNEREARAELAADRTYDEWKDNQLTGVR